MTRTIEIIAGKDERSTGEGFSCAELLFILKDGDTAATFACLTDWLPAGMGSGFVRPSAYLKPLDLTFHFPDQTLTALQNKREECPYISGKCHSIRDHKNGVHLRDALLKDGSDGVWRELEKLFVQESRINRPGV